MSVPVFILAAGASRRLGQPKQLVEIAGQPLIRRQCHTALAAGVGPVFVVLGCGADACRAAIADLPVTLLDNPQWEEGLAASLRVAAARARADSAAAMLLLHVDQYALTASDLAKLVSCWRGEPTRAHLARDGAHSGPPVVIPAGVFDAILGLKGDQGARGVLPGVVENGISGASKDIDEPAQLPAVI